MASNPSSCQRNVSVLALARISDCDPEKAKSSPAAFDDDKEETKLCKPLVSARRSPAERRASIPQIPVGLVEVARTDNFLLADIAECNLASRIEGNNVVNVHVCTFCDASQLVPEITALTLDRWCKACFCKLARPRPFDAR
jgi:hypothetical protein